MSTTADFATIDIDGLANKIQNVDAKVIQSAKDLQDGAIGVNKFKDSANVASKATAKFGATLKTVAANVGIMLAITATVKFATAIWDKFDTTVGEAQSDLEETQGTIKSLKEQIKELEGLDANSLTQGQKDKLENLKEQLKVQEQLEEIEKRRLAREVIGNGNFADYFDKDSYKNNKRKLHNVTEDASYNLNSVSGTFTSRQAYISSLNDQLKNTDGLNKEQIERLENSLLEANRQQDISRETILDIQESLIANKVDIQTWMSQIQTYIDEGYIVGSDLTRANEILKELQILLNGTNDEIERTNTLLYGGDDSIESVIAEKTKYTYQNLLDNGFTKDEIEILSTLTFDKNATLKELRTILEEAQKKANENPVEPEVKFSKSQMIDTINSMSDGFDVLDDIYADVFDKGSFDFTKLDSSKFEDAFGDLKPEYEEFIETVSESPTDINACQDAFNELATAFIKNKGILENLTEENANVASAMLRNMGIANAEEIVTAQLAYNTEMLAIKKAFAAETGRELTSATYEEINGFLQESSASDEAKFALAQLAIAKINCNNASIDASSDIENLLAIAKTAGFTSEQLIKLESIKSRWQHQIKIGNKGGAELLESQYKKTLAEVQTDIANFNPVVDVKTKIAPKYTGGDQTASAMQKAAEESAKDAKDAYGDMFDFFERRVKVLEDAFENLSAGIENVVGADAKNTLLSAQLGILDEETRNYTDALAMYKEQANNVLSTIADEELRKKIVDGSVSLVDLQGENNEQVKAALDAYSGWADKVAECTQKLEELKAQIRQLELQKFNNIVEDFTDQFDIRGTAIDNIDKQIALLEESGELVGKGYYEQQITQAEGQLNILEKQKADMVKSLADAISSGRIQKGTDEWQEMVTAIQKVDGQIIECKTDIEKFNNSIQQIEWDNFKRVQDVFTGIHDELGNLASLFDDQNDIAVSDGKGNWTNEAIATMGLHAQDYETAKKQVSDYANEIAELEADYAAGDVSATEYIDRLSELKQGQWAAVKAMEAAEDAIVSLNEKRVQESIETINKEIEAYKELVDAKIEALDAEKDLHDYRESIAEKSKSITDIEKRLAAMANDDSLAARAEKAQLQEQLAEAKKDLEEEEYNHSIDAQKDALNKQYEDYEAARQKEIEQLEATLKNREALLAMSFETVKNNAIIVGQEILAIAQQHGINVDSVITTAWANGSNAIASYGATLTAQSSSFISNLMNVESQVYSLQTQADNTSYSIANMFGQMADTLINELTNSWISADNLNTMVGTLQNSLINTLERGYDISAITSALGAVESAANSAKDAIDRMNNTTFNPPTVPDSSIGNRTTIQTSIGKDGTTYDIRDIDTGKIYESYPTYQQAYDKWKDFNGYAKGSKYIDEDQLAWTDEYGKREMIIRPSDGAILTRLEKGDAVANAALTENLFKWGEINPGRFMQGLSSMTSPKINVPMKSSQPNIVLDYDLNIGNFTDGEHLLNTIQKVSKDSAEKIINDINRDFKRHGR